MNRNPHRLKTLQNYLSMVKSHPVFAAKHPELVEKLEGYVKTGEEGGNLDWTQIMQFIMMILQLLFHV